MIILQSFIVFRPNMKVLVLFSFVVLSTARPDVGLGYNYQVPATSYGVPSGSVQNLNTNRAYYHVKTQNQAALPISHGTQFGPTVPSTVFQTPIHEHSSFTGSGTIDFGTRSSVGSGNTGSSGLDSFNQQSISSLPSVGGGQSGNTFSSGSGLHSVNQQSISSVPSVGGAQSTSFGVSSTGTGGSFGIGDDSTRFNLFGANEGGWYILRDWNKDDFDPKAILKQLHVKYGVTPYFKVTVESDPYVRGQSVIRISPSGLGLPDREYYYLDQEDRIQNAYKELIRDVVKYLSSTRNEAEKFGKDIFYYEKRIAEITPSYKYSKDPIKTCNHVKLSELKETAGTIPFYDILTEMFPEANINESTEVLVTSLEYLTSISQIIASTDRQTFNGYLMWTLVYKYLPYLSDKFTSAFHNFQAELLGAHEPLKRWEMCATLIQDFMSFAALVDDEIKNPINENSRGVINETYHSILNVVHKRLEKFRTMPDLYNHLKRKLLTISLQVGFPKEVKESAYIKDYYAKLRIIKTNLFESVKFGIEFKKKLEEKRLVKSSPDQAIVQQLCQHPREVTYLPSYNLIAIPKSLLIQPFFEEEYPRAVIYARLGVEIADAVLSAILPYNSFWTHDKKLLSPYHQTVNDSLKSISKARYCLYKYILNQNLTLLYDTADETALMVLKQISAVGIANEALISASSHREHIHQSGLEEYDDSPLFFLSYAQTQCSESTNQFQTYNNIVNFKLPQRSVLHILWSQLLTFSESLECSANKKDTCSDIF